MSRSAWLTQMKRGLLELCILNLLDQERMYGYQIAKTLEGIPGLVATEGTLYPLISRLKKENLLVTTFEESPNGPVRKMYELSEDGKAKKEELNRLWKEVSYSIAKIISKDSDPFFK